MTITKKPTAAPKAAGSPVKTAKAKPKAAKKPEKAADAFIQAADHPAPARRAAKKRPATIEVAADKAKVKDKVKGKEKDKKKKKDKEKDNKKKEAVIIRFEDRQLKQIDAESDALGLSRAAWVRMIVAKALPAR